MLSHFCKLMSCKLMLGVGIVALMLSPLSAHAGLVVGIDGPPIQSPGYTPGYSQYSYSLTSDPTTFLTDGDYFTISGIDGLYNALSPAGFTASDSQSAGTVTYTYVGASPTGANLHISGFEINTLPGYANNSAGYYSAVGTTVGGPVITSGPILATVPEPHTAWLFPIALLTAAVCFHFMNRFFAAPARLE